MTVALQAIETKRSTYYRWLKHYSELGVKTPVMAKLKIHCFLARDYQKPMYRHPPSEV